MKLLFDQGTPAPFRKHLSKHFVDTLAEKGWSDRANGELLDLAEREDYEVLVTTDQNLRHQQNQAGRQMGIVVILSANWPKIRRRVHEVDEAVIAVRHGGLTEVSIGSK